MAASLVLRPVYQQLHDRLRTALTAEYQCGDQFLTERDTSDKFQVSRPTANKVLASLVSEGLLEFRKGLGTFVRRHVLDYDVRSLVSFTEKARAAGKKTSTQLLTFGKLTASAADEMVRTALAIESDATLWELDRVRPLCRVSSLSQTDEVSVRGIALWCLDRNTRVEYRRCQRGHSRCVAHDRGSQAFTGSCQVSGAGGRLGWVSGGQLSPVVGANALSWRPV